MTTEPARSRRTLNWRGILSVAVIAAVLYLAANPTEREDWRKTLNTQVIPGLQKTDPGLVAGTIWGDTLNCPPASTHCENLFGQVIRLPGALVHAAQIIIGTGWPGIAMGVLTVILMAPVIAGSLDNPFMWPIALLIGSLVAGIALWVLKWVIIFVAWALVWILWGIALTAGWILMGEWVLRGMEVRRALAGGSHDPAAEPTPPGKAGRAGV